MKQGKRILALVLALVLVIGVLPMSAFASTSAVVDGDSGDAPLASIKYNGTVYKPDSHKVIEILVPNNNGKAVSISTSDIGTFKDNSGYKIGSHEFQDKTVKMEKDMDGASTKVTIFYTKTGDDTKYKVDYTLGFERDEFKAPSFNGDITVELDTSDTSGHSFKNTDFTKLYSKNDGTDIKYIEIEGESDIAQFKVSSSAYNGEKLTTSKMSNLKLIPKAAGSAWFTVYAYDSNGDKVDGDVTIDVTVKNSGKLSKLTEKITQTETLTLSSVGLAAAFKKAAGSEMTHVTFTELPEYGDIKNGTTAVKTKTAYTAAEFAKMKFTPSKSKVTKTVTDSFSYTAEDSDGNSYKGTVDIRIIYDELDIDDITVNMKMNGVLSLSSAKIPTAFKDDTKLTLDYVYFYLPDEGELRYNYKSSSSKGTLVDEDTEYYNSTSSSKKTISNVSYIPEKNFKGTVYIGFIGYDTKNEDPYEGRIVVKVADSDMSDIDPYEIDNDEVMSFKEFEVSADINAAFKDMTKSNYSYVKFDLPDSDEGILRYGYTSDSKPGTKLTSSTKVYRSGSTGVLMSDVVFIPDEDFTGTCQIDFTAYSDDDEYDGTLTIKVGGTDYDIATLKYTIDSGKTFTFKPSDINTKFKKAAGETLDYIIFETVPASKKGTLYYNYKSSTGKGTKVDVDDDEFYYNDKSENLISDLVFVPASGASGAMTFVYWGYSGRDSYEGKIVVTVSEASKDVADLTYKINNNQLLKLSSADIATQFKKVSSETLDYIKLELPGSAAGTLYYDYTSAVKNGGIVFADDELYRTGSKNLLIDSVTLVPNIDYVGTFDIKYTAYDEDEQKYSGKITVTVTEPTTFPDNPKTINGTASWYYNSSKWGVGRGIVAGALDADGVTRLHPEWTCTWAHILTFLWRANGSPEPTAKSAGDIKGDEWYAKAILWAVEKNIAPSGATSKGTKGGYESPCTRAQALQFIYKSFGSPSVSGLSNKFTDVKSSDEYYNAVLWGVDTGITNGTNPNAPVFEPNTTCTRGHIITFLYRAYEKKDLAK